MPLVGTLLLPVAIRAGLPPLVGAAAIAIAGQGMALSSDYMIQIAPMLSATAAGVPVSDVADRALVLSLIAGGTAMILLYLLARRRKERLRASFPKEWMQPYKQRYTAVVSWKAKLFAAFVPLAFLAVILYMLYTSFLQICSWKAAVELHWLVERRSCSC